MNTLSSDKKSAGGLKPTREKYFGIILRLTDMVLICGVLLFSCNMMERAISPIYAWRDIYTAPTVFALLCFLLIGEYDGLYRIWRSRSIWAESSRMLGCWLITIPTLLILGYVTKSSEQYSRAIFLVWFIATPVVLILWRTALRLVLRKLRKHGHNIKRIAIAGYGPAALSVEEHVKKSPWMGYKLIGTFHQEGAQTEDKVGSPLDELFRLAEAHALDSVYITYPLEQQETIKRIVSRLADTNVQVYLLPGLFMSGLLQSKWSELGTLPVIDVYSSPLLGADGCLKRIFDLSLSLILLPLLAIPMTLIAIAIKLSSPGPAIFKQKRYGMDGSEIDMLKFRTMFNNDKPVAVTQATPNDPRITPLGQWLRSTSLDELPQIFNVLRGEMSLVGPRPHAVEHDEYYRQLIHGYMLRQKVPPGITGLAQVNGYRGRTEVLNKMEKRVEYDLFYIRNWSISLDVKILFLTLRYGFNSKNAY